MVALKNVRTHIQYFFRGKIRTSILQIVNAEGGDHFWFYFKNSPPSYLIKRDDVWIVDGTRELTDQVEQYELWKALADAIEAKNYGDNFAPEASV